MTALDTFKSKWPQWAVIASIALTASVTEASAYTFAEREASTRIAVEHIPYGSDGMRRFRNEADAAVGEAMVFVEELRVLDPREMTEAAVTLNEASGFFDDLVLGAARSVKLESIRDDAGNIHDLAEQSNSAASTIKEALERESPRISALADIARSLSGLAHAADNGDDHEIRDAFERLDSEIGQYNERFSHGFSMGHPYFSRTTAMDGLRQEDQSFAPSHP